MRNAKEGVSRIIGLGIALVLAAVFSMLIWVPQGHADGTTVDMTKKGSITVHSVEGDTGVPATGAEANDLSNQIITGSEFKLTKDSTDVSTLAGMQAAARVTTTNFTADNNFDAQTCRTGTDGSCKFDQLVPGVYKLEQIKAPTGKQNAAPAIVVLPLTNPAGTGFMYDIHVYPKNAIIGSIKKVNTTPADTLLKEGAEMTFKITVPIPKHNADTKKFTAFTVTDEPVSGLTVAESGITSVVLGTETLTSDTHYTVSKTGNNVKVTFVDAGLTKLSGSTERELIVNVKGTVTNIATAKVVKNKAAYAYKLADGTNNTGGKDPNGNDPGSEGVETNGNDSSQTTFGYVKIKNTDGTTNELTGGKFKVGKCAANGKSVAAGQEVATDATTGNSVGPIGPLAKLCVEQTTAPTGYALNPEATAIEFTAEKITNANDKTLEALVTNTSNNDFLGKLPLTGGPGVIALLSAGAVLMLVAVALMSRKRHQD
ncbi:SpaH/EbpB family LPXTG-anchored major pilin [Mobiluncus curtisii]|uniref:SpaH/EbpB family LPXTG-anchored major pilin n=1 Tax=Mobiluncus curtisii TaxID=2051 RepID=UPI0014701168|nr:SpaH/EbpB family LPXTG-anchored major pilin [Mobiluncus curtisii]NMW45247.1 SpaH/EbpB family LPXTG-anchored major pilin [Mobiluncus curtisii]NMW83750.1 SpaH/EbpB family LPXTG-anchored major pilin [Mobiluncus curtisii]NMW98994.1 SpaH/EbpB family LPXTG-anchored major pilin [Mobiluncus curtisii]